ncbi:MULTISPECIES: head-tail connector protein [Alphaproteobacteria]|uniref:PhiE125 gp8 family phage protein n=2 Tax=Alphaproteobacteria TaxID=28211 RepID=A0A512HG01_9HYPH|nr:MULTISPECIES: head-tail connector protein [Alphaproteobacteria]GEO84377.1 hypothetical protein RNA01_13090 [Ciceribacter naphthalenivorans]GLR22340.1 hypothetical protein GCM10007920_21270 [Ciceribacter naphthalenivorans]GLT05196.1 hypothetical protein GCM10007926_21270 [Sphingomonas psychrolutea]
MTYIQTIPPAAEPLTLVEAKAHLRVDGADEDALIAALVTVAREHIERETGLALITQGFRLCLDDWPRDGVIQIVRGPVREVTGVIVYDGEGDPAAVSLTDHLLDGEARPARLWLRDPPALGRELNGIEIDFTAGYGASGADVPDTLKRAMLLHVAVMFAVRGAIALDSQPAAIPPGYERLIAPFCRRGL